MNAINEMEVLTDGELADRYAKNWYRESTLPAAPLASPSSKSSRSYRGKHVPQKQ